MLLSAVAQTGECFGAVHIVDILCGSASEKIQSRGHDRISSFGGGRERSRTFWQGFVRQLVAGGYMAIDIEGYGGLKLAERGRLVLQDAENFHYREIPDSPKSAKATARKRAADLAELDIDAELLSRLKTLRRELAQDRKVPAYVVFADATLHDMCRSLPETLDGMAQVSGVGPKKLKDFGEVFLDAIREHNLQV